MKKSQINNKNKTNKFSKNHYDDEIVRLKKEYENISKDSETFDDMPLSQKTKKGLFEAKFKAPTEIQKLSIGAALQGKDVLAAAITGSGKTLAFLVPVLEHLYMNKWSRNDGVCAIIISPTRELAYQIFETLRLIGKYHDFSAGLIIGGKNLKFEKRRIDQCNIFICTPGRLLQHMDENPLFNVSTMEMLVLDEADRCLDMGFEKTINAIVENFPPQRQTLLFSATQTNSIKDLARLNLKSPVYIGIQKEEAFLSVPELLQQSYVVIPLEEKVTMLWSFIKNHTKQKIIVFMSTCKQVKYIYEIFCKLRPGISLLALYGTLHQDRRIAIYNDFVKKNHVVMFATDVASRGLDFPAVNWVVQLDCPEDVPQYIHRAGRSARNKTHGESLLVLLPTEEEHMIADLNKQSINVRKITIDPKKMFSPRAKIEAFLAQNSELKASAQRAFLSYIKSVFLMKNKQIFKIFELNFDAFAQSLGLVITPRVRYLERIMHKKSTSNTKNIDSEVDEDINDSVEKAKQNNHITKQTDFAFGNSESESDDDFIKVKRLNHDFVGNSGNTSNDSEVDETIIKSMKKEKLLTKAKIAKKVLKKKIQINVKKTFNEDGEEMADPRKEMQSEMAKKYQNDDAGGIDLAIAKQLLSEEDKYDKQRFRELVKQRHKQEKQKLKHKLGKIESDEEAFHETDDIGQSDSEDSVDLSWLPDPDKIYNNSDSNQEKTVNTKTDQNNEVESDFEYDEPATKKSKITSKLTLDDAEAIAEKLLANAF